MKFKVNELGVEVRILNKEKKADIIKQLNKFKAKPDKKPSQYHQPSAKDQAILDTLAKISAQINSSNSDMSELLQYQRQFFRSAPQPISAQSLALLLASGVGCVREALDHSHNPQKIMN